MAPLKQKGDLAELLVAADLRRRGYLISLPYGEDSPYDLVLDRVMVHIGTSSRPAFGNAPRRRPSAN